MRWPRYRRDGLSRAGIGSLGLHFRLATDARGLRPNIRDVAPMAMVIERRPAAFCIAGFDV